MKLRIAGAALALVMLAGCAPQGDPEPTPTASATAEPSASPTPTTEPEPDFSDPANWIIGFDAVGPLSLGQPIDDARAALVDYVENEPVPDCRVAFLTRAGYPSLALVYWPDDVLSGIWVRNNIENSGIASVDLYAVSPKTAEGLGIGSSLDDFMTAYPDHTVIREDGDFFAVYSVAGPSGYIVVTLTDGVVDAIVTRPDSDFGFELC